ncbi:hypothetical protein PybrP1_004694 [[Pythium] brassicae (nom. inval.)]|nr:hypothetical protein PybrP1_004694 [[Pythium] brassicae (nom. inval.)]
MALDELSLSSPATSPPSLLPGAHSLERAAQTTRVALVFFLLEFAVLWLLCAALVVHLRFKREAARRGDDAAARKIILPAFEPLLIVLAVFNGLFVVFMAATLATGFYDTYIPPVVLETLYSAHQFGFVAILVFMLQKSVSLPALWRAMALSLVLSGYTIPYIWAVTTYGDPAKQLTYVKWLHPLRALWLVLSVYVFVWPPGRASKRTLRELAVYNIVRYALTTVHMVLIMNPATRAKGEYVLDDGADRRYAKAKATSKKVHRPSTTDVDDAPGSTSSLNTVREDEGSMGHMTVKGTADYMAPEVISGRGGVAYYDQAADVYSLAITLWDILNPGADKFPSRSHLCVFDMVLRGVRPALDPSLPASLRDVIQRAWQPDPRLRPSALAVIAVLEGVQEALSAAFIVDVMDELQPYSLQSEATVGSGLAVVAGAGGSANRHFLGIGAADMLVDHKYVNSHVEAARMGNAWMDAGLLHHAKHARAFEPSGTAVYYFAVDSSATLREAMEAACQPEPSNIPILSGPQHHHPHPHAQRSRFSNSSSRASSFSVSGKRIRAVEPCSCKRYAQRTLDESGWYNFRRKQPSAAARARNPDDMVLTTALLMDSDDDLDAFVAGGGSHA